MGPSHYKYFKHCVLSQANTFECPLGNIPVNTEIVGKLLESVY